MFKGRQLNCVWLWIRGCLSEEAFFSVTERWIETADCIWRRIALCARNSILQMICLALKFPPLHFSDYIKYLCCKASGSLTAWFNSVPPYFSFSILLYISPFLSLVQWSQREPDSGSPKESLQGSCGDQEPVSGTFFFFCTAFRVCECGVRVHAHVSLAFQRVSKCAQPPCACASIFHCVKCHAPPACCIDRHRCSLAAVCVFVCATDVPSCGISVVFSLCFVLVIVIMIEDNWGSFSQVN